MEAIDRYLKKASPEFAKIFEELQKTVKQVFPDAEEIFEWGMPGWRVQRKIPAPTEPVKGTIDPRYVTILFVERKGGTSLHVWNPGDFYGLEKERKKLEGAGFKVMRACLEYRRKGEYPLRVLEKVFQAVKASAQA